MKFEEKKASCSMHIIDYRIACEECQEKNKYMIDFIKREQECKHENTIDAGDAEHMVIVCIDCNRSQQDIEDNG